jgi:hypothetical protein
MRKRRIKIPRQEVEDQLQHLTLSCSPVGGTANRIASSCATYLSNDADDETEVILQALHERRQPRLDLMDEEDSDDSSSSQPPTTWTNSSYQPTFTSDMSSILESTRSGRAMVAAAGRGAGKWTDNTATGATPRDAGVGLIDCIVFYLREVKHAVGRTCCRDYHGDNPGLGYHNYLPSTQCELPQLSYDGEAFKSSRSIDITYLRKRRYAGSNCSEFDHLPHLFRGPAGAAQLMTHGGKMIDQSIPTEVITPQLYETNANMESFHDATSAQLVPHRGKLKMVWLKRIVKLPVHILLRPRRRRKNAEVKITPEGEAGTYPNKNSFDMVSVVVSLPADNEQQKMATDITQTKPPSGVRQSDNGNLAENQRNGRVKRKTSPPIQKRMEDKQQHNGRLKRNQSPPIRKRMEEKQYHTGQMKIRSKSPPPTKQQMLLHLHPRHRTAAVGKHKVNKNASLPLDEQLPVNNGSKGRPLQSAKKKMHHAGPLRHVKRRY